MTKHKGMKKQQTRTEKKPSKHDLRKASETSAGHNSKVYLSPKPIEITDEKPTSFPPKGSYYYRS